MITQNIPLQHLKLEYKPNSTPFKENMCTHLIMYTYILSQLYVNFHHCLWNKFQKKQHFNGYSRTILVIHLSPLRRISAIIHLKHWSILVAMNITGNGALNTKAVRNESGSITSQPQIISTLKTNLLSPAPLFIPVKHATW